MKLLKNFEKKEVFVVWIYMKLISMICWCYLIIYICEDIKYVNKRDGSYYLILF